MIQALSNNQIKLLAKKVVDLTLKDDKKGALKSLKPLLDTKCPFSKLDLLGKEIGQISKIYPQKIIGFLDQIIDYNAMGSFVIVGQALISFLENNFEDVMQKSREYIIRGDKWYVCDIIGERSLGQALIYYFDETIPWLEEFLKDENKWVRRSAGVAVHFFSKRILDQPVKTRKLLKLLEPYIEERQRDVVKGIGWGLKTIGRYHPITLCGIIVS